MKTRILIGTFAAAGLALGVGQMTAIAVPGDGGTSDSQAPGTDVIVGAINGVSNYGTNTVGGVALYGYAFGTTSCNIGTAVLRWSQASSFHPVIPQNCYRIKNGRIEQIGMSWMKYGFCALQESLCMTCQSGGVGCGSSQSTLGIGCSDPYGSSLNGTQSGLGPRSHVNASTGYFPGDTSTEIGTWPAMPNGQSLIARRIQIKADDLNPTLNVGAVYLAEAQYVHPDDAAANNDNNNASYIKVTVAASGYAMALSGSTFQQKPAIYHWAQVVPTVAYSVVDAPDGRFIVGYNTSVNPNGTTHYEYAIYNFNSDASGSSFSVPIANGVTVTNATFKDISYHSNEVYDGTDWTITNSAGVLKWQCTQTFAQNVNANALRFGTLYNFAFDANTVGVAGSTSLGLFKTAGSIAVPGLVPAAFCRIGDLDCNGVVDGADLGTMLSAWGPCPGGTPGCAGDLDRDTAVSGSDLGTLLANWG
ncbi:MAG: hypothetical protein DWH86_03095 [Planctomycetota bacterium]|nr:MAG: hypothetical protein DWH86_03095 [Planctomycetota bacterium]